MFVKQISLLDNLKEQVKWRFKNHILLSLQVWFRQMKRHSIIRQLISSYRLHSGTQGLTYLESLASKTPVIAYGNPDNLISDKNVRNPYYEEWT